MSTTPQARNDFAIEMAEAHAALMKAGGWQALLDRLGVEPSAAATMKQPQRDAAARKAGQRSPSEKTWGVVLEKLTVKSEARLALVA